MTLALLGGRERGARYAKLNPFFLTIICSLQFQIEVDFGSSESSERLISNFLRGRKKVFIVCILVVELIWILRGCDTFCLSYCTGQFVLRDNVKCVSKVLGQMWALLALRGVPGLLRHILGLISGAV